MRALTALPWLALAGVIGYYTWHDTVTAPDAPALPALQAEQPLPAAGGGPVSYAPAVARAAPAVVNIYTTQTVRETAHPFFGHPWFAPPQTRERTASSLGSGVIVSADGYVLTNDHVVARADRIVVALRDGREVAATVVGSDPDSDLAVLRIQLDKLPVLPFRSSPSAVGDVVLAIGNPFGVGQTVTQGIISALGRSGLGINTYEDFIQTDAAINPGNSGGALVDVAGNLLGINTAIYSRSGGSMGIGFAIPAAVARDVMNDIVSQGRVVRGWLGVEIARRGDDDAVVIASVLPGGPGDRGGLRDGDVLRQVEGEDVTSPDQVIRQIGRLKPGKSVAVQVDREGREKLLTVTMGERPRQRRREE